MTGAQPVEPGSMSFSLGFYFGDTSLQTTQNLRSRVSVKLNVRLKKGNPAVKETPVKVTITNVVV